MGRTSTARERLLDAAGTLMRHRGYSGLGVAEICAAAEVKKGSFYHFFDSKQDLTLQAIDAYWGEQQRSWAAELDGSGPALDRLRRLLEGMALVQRRGKRPAARSTAACSGTSPLNSALRNPKSAPGWTRSSTSRPR